MDGEDVQNTNNSDGNDQQNADTNGGSGVHNSDNNDDEDLHNANDDDGEDIQSTDYSDGERYAESTDYTDDEDLDNADYEFGGYLYFERMYRCYQMSFLEKDHLEMGDKAFLEIDYPMLFELSNPSAGKVTHCGVLEFTAGEGIIYLPVSMMEGMLAKEGDFVFVKYSVLLKGTYVKMQPHTMDFLSISNPKAVLERTLRSCSCLTTFGTIMIDYNNKKFYVDILETKPSPAVCIVDTDCEVEFDPPLDYKEPEKPANSTRLKVDDELEKKMQKFSPFGGSVRRLDGKPLTQLVEPVSFPLMQLQPKNGIGTNDSTTNSPPIKQQSALLVFGSNSKDASNGKQKTSSKVSMQDPPQMEEEKKFKAFTGKKYFAQ